MKDSKKTIMKRFIYALLICVVCFSFSGKNEDLVLEILNPEILSRGNILDKNIRDVTRFDNYIYDSIPVNKINFKLTNTGTKKYVLFINKDFDKAESFSAENLKINIFKEKELFHPTALGFALNLTTKGFEYRKFINELEGDSLRQEFNRNYLKEGISSDNLEFQKNADYVVIHPGETRFFMYYKTMPIFLENTDSYYMYKFNSNENYYFQMSLKNNSKELQKRITSNQAKEIQENGYTLFDGIIRSNKVPINFVKK